MNFDCALITIEYLSYLEIYALSFEIKIAKIVLDKIKKSRMGMALYEACHFNSCDRYLSISNVCKWAGKYFSDDNTYDIFDSKDSISMEYVMRKYRMPEEEVFIYKQTRGSNIYNCESIIAQMCDVIKIIIPSIDVLIKTPFMNFMDKLGKKYDALYNKNKKKFSHMRHPFDYFIKYFPSNLYSKSDIIKFYSSFDSENEKYIYWNSTVLDDTDLYEKLINKFDFTPEEKEHKMGFMYYTVVSNNAMNIFKKIVTSGDTKYWNWSECFVCLKLPNVGEMLYFILEHAPENISEYLYGYIELAIYYGDMHFFTEVVRMNNMNIYTLPIGYELKITEIKSYDVILYLAQKDIIFTLKHAYGLTDTQHYTYKSMDMPSELYEKYLLLAPKKDWYDLIMNSYMSGDVGMFEYMFKNMSDDDYQKCINFDSLRILRDDMRKYRQHLTPRLG